MNLRWKDAPTRRRLNIVALSIALSATVAVGVWMAVDWAGGGSDWAPPPCADCPDPAPLQRVVCTDYEGAGVYSPTTARMEDRTFEKAGRPAWPAPVAEDCRPWPVAGRVQIKKCALGAWPCKDNRGAAIPTPTTGEAAGWDVHLAPGRELCVPLHEATHYRAGWYNRGGLNLHTDRPDHLNNTDCGMGTKWLKRSTP